MSIGRWVLGASGAGVVGHGTRDSLQLCNRQGGEGITVTRQHILRANIGPACFLSL